MIKLLKSLFTDVKKENKIAKSIEIKEMPATDWWK